jgi:hypothetical protein
MFRLGQLRRLTIFLGASHQLENMKCARIMKNKVDINLKSSKTV